MAPQSELHKDWKSIPIRNQAYPVQLALCESLRRGVHLPLEILLLCLPMALDLARDRRKGRNRSASLCQQRMVRNHVLGR